MSLATDLIAARERLTISQREAAKRTGVPLRTYQAWERGENEPGDKKARDVRAALGIGHARVRPEPLSAEEAAGYYAAQPAEPGAAVLIITVQNGAETSTHELRWSHGPPLHVGISTNERPARSR